MSKNKKDKKGLAKKIDKKILKALKERYLKAKKEKADAKAAYKLALDFFKKNKSKSKKTKSDSTKSKTLPPKKPIIKKVAPAKPKSNASVTSLNQLDPTPAKVAKKLPKTLRVKKQKAAPKKATPKKAVTKATPKPVAKLPRVTPKKIVPTPKVTPKKVVAKATPKPTPKPTISKKQMADLKVVEGVGPAIERLLKAKGIKTLNALGKAKIGTLRGILEDAGSRFRFHKPDTWARQARLAASGKWKQLDELQKLLDGGKKK